MSLHFPCQIALVGVVCCFQVQQCWLPFGGKVPNNSKNELGNTRGKARRKTLPFAVIPSPFSPHSPHTELPNAQRLLSVHLRSPPPFSPLTGAGLALQCPSRGRRKLVRCDRLGVDTSIWEVLSGLLCWLQCVRSQDFRSLLGMFCWFYSRFQSCFWSQCCRYWLGTKVFKAVNGDSFPS